MIWMIWWIRLLLVAIILGSLALSLVTLIRYRITSQNLEVRFLGLCLRRLPLDDIRYISKHRSGWAEFWWNTPWPAKRVLVIRRRSGWLKNFVITPRNRYVFKAELNRARQQPIEERDE
ncbi:MAG: hypothetical protein HY043_06275 [Verrucomicrobia bacterium]|nr:hypothetical protein [Verrucomicrobiota bacterium]